MVSWSTLVFISAYFAVSRGCHNEHDGAHTDDETDDYDDLFSRKKRTVSDAATDTAYVRSYITACLETQLPSSPYDWRSTVDFGILDSLWYLNTHQTYCSAAGGGETQECWQEEASKFLKGDSNVLRTVQTCIAHYTEDIGAEPPRNRYHKERQKRNSVPVNRNQAIFDEVPLSFGSEGLPNYANCLDASINFKQNRLPLNFRNLSLFIDGNTVDGCNSRKAISGRQPDPLWPYRFVTLTRPDSLLRRDLELCAKQIYPPGYFGAEGQSFPIPDALININTILSSDHRINFDDAYWSSWGGWSVCSTTCGYGVRSRKRRCRSGVDSRETSSSCVGHLRETRPCNQGLCRVYAWGNWRSFSRCSKSCGGGTQFRSRRCRLNNLQNVKLIRCKSLGGRGRQKRVCNSAECPKIYSWSPWMPFTACKVEPMYGSDGCRRGRHTRSRVCQLNRQQQAPVTNCNGTDDHQRRLCYIECVKTGSNNFTLSNFTFALSLNAR